MLVALAVTTPQATASASPYPGVAIDPSYGPPLSAAKITGSGFCAASCGPVAINFAGVYVASIAVRADGSFSFLVQVPGSARPGTAAVIASQTAQPSARTTFTVTISAGPPRKYPQPTSRPFPGGQPIPASTSQQPLPTKPNLTTGTPASTFGPSRGPDPPTTHQPTAVALPPQAQPAAQTYRGSSRLSELFAALTVATTLIVITLFIVRRKRRLSPDQPSSRR